MDGPEGGDRERALLPLERRSRGRTGRHAPTRDEGSDSAGGDGWEHRRVGAGLGRVGSRLGDGSGRGRALRDNQRLTESDPSRHPQAALDNVTAILRRYSLRSRPALAHTSIRTLQPGCQERTPSGTEGFLLGASGPTGPLIVAASRPRLLTASSGQSHQGYRRAGSGLRR